ncbi:hypothetical protein PA598K_03407 [Paenibacillus sp. 598K]|uniref:hypothetical protein n=1 Tax=Paenibacillus sp. 598K TaxID=1117987 RepID=UPI000FF9EF3B|nr:hypothetical protein [Paenibacillus sp. 598K]GBF75028.1 hypothetical protein PA598K_03407 [Paenibacillus sp. 598K]
MPLIKILPLYAENVFQSYSYHAYMSSILLDDRKDEDANVRYSNLKVDDCNPRWYQQTIGDGEGSQPIEATVMEELEELNRAWCHKGDITGRSDNFQYLYAQAEAGGHKGIEVRIEQIKFTSVWAKAGLMLRESLAADARYVYIFATPAMNGGVIQCREQTGKENTMQFALDATPPVWLRIELHEGEITLMCGKERGHWDFSKRVDHLFPAGMYMGLALCTPEEHAHMNWYASTYIQLYSYKDFSMNRIPFDFQIGLHKDGDFYFCCPYLRTQAIRHSLIERLESSGNDLIRLMLQFIDDGNYVDVEMNEFFVPDRKAYGKYNRMHGSLIYGYNTETQLFYLAGYAAGNVFKQSQMTFEQFRRAFDRDRDKNIRLLQLHHYRSFALDTTAIRDQLTHYMNATNAQPGLSMNVQAEPKIVYGLEAYDSLIHNLPLHLQDIRPLQVVYEHKRMMSLRLEHLHRLQALDHLTFEWLSEEYRNLERLALLCRNLQLKNAVTPNTRYVDSMLANIMKIKTKESELLPLLLEQLP